MARPKDSGRINLREVFLRVQDQMLANLSASEVFEHPTSCGAATEQHWIDLFNRYLPQRYRATRAFIVDANGHRSRQIDIAIYDPFYSPLLFHHGSEPHIPAESVYAVFEVKPTFSRQWLRDASEKAASVRALRRTSVRVPGRSKTRPVPILAGLLATGSVWTPRTFSANLVRALKPVHLDIGCCLKHGAFDRNQFSVPSEALIFFMLHLIHRLQLMGTAPAIDWPRYARSISCDS